MGSCIGTSSSSYGCPSGIEGLGLITTPVVPQLTAYSAACAAESIIWFEATG